MLNTYIIPDPATVPDDYDLAAELTARGLPTRWIGEFCEHTGNDVRIAFYDQATDTTLRKTEATRSYGTPTLMRSGTCPEAT